jgi:hypothetical protein
MDAGALARVIYDAVVKKKEAETFTDDPVLLATKETENKENMMLWNIVSFFISVAIGGFAFYLSWRCNTALDYHVAVKAIFGVFAFFFGLIYLILYVIMRMDTCGRLIGSRVL